MVQVRLGAPTFFSLEMELNFILPLVLFLFGGFTSLIIKNKRVLTLIFNITSLFALCFFTYLLLNTFVPTPETKLFYLFGNFGREVGVEYSLNSLNVSILTFVSLIIFLFSIFFSDFTLKYEKEFNFNLLFCIIQIFCGASLAILMTNDLFNFYIFFELLAICSYIFTSLGGKGAAYSALNYLILGMVASGFIVLGIGFLYFSTGFLNIYKVAEIIRQNSINVSMPCIFIVLGFLIKLAIFPFSFWQGLVYKSMPSAIMPLYAAIVSMVTLYCFNLFLANFFTSVDFLHAFKGILMILTIIGVLTFSFFSLFENDVRKIFAYSTISQVSYAFFMLFVDAGKGAEFAFLHLFSNSLSKFALFIILFSIGKEKNVYNIGIFEGLAGKSKYMHFIILFLFAGIIGLPLTLGFFTKISMIFTSFKAESYYFVGILLLGAMLNFLYFWRLGSVMFFNKKESSEKLTFPLATLIPVSITVIILVLSTVFFGYISSYETKAIEIFYLPNF